MAYINLNDPEVRYSHNYGNSEVYIISPEAERIDLVRCEECKHNSLNRMSGNAFCEFGHAFSQLNDYCSDGKRRVDDKETD